MNRTRATRRVGTSRGWTLVDASIALAVTSVLAGVAVGPIHAMSDRHHLEGLASQLESELTHARFTAVASQRTVHFGVSSGAAHSCWVAYTGARGDCSCAGSETATCAPGAQVLSSHRLPHSGPASVSANVSSITFGAVNGTATPTATLAVTGRHGAQLNLVVNLVGRVRSCAPAPGLPGHVAC